MNMYGECMYIGKRFLTWYLEMSDKLHSPASLPSGKQPPVPIL